MKVLLKENIKNIGKKGDVINVSDGYARNFLFPKKLAYPATPDIVAHTQERKAKEEATAQEKKTAVDAIAKKLQGQTFSFTVKTKEGKGVFSSVHDQEIADAILEFVNKKSGQGLNKEDIHVSTKPLKELGEHTIDIKLGKGDWAKNVAVVIVISGQQS